MAANVSGGGFGVARYLTARPRVATGANKSYESSDQAQPKIVSQRTSCSS